MADIKDLDKIFEQRSRAKKFQAEASAELEQLKASNLKELTELKAVFEQEQANHQATISRMLKEENIFAEEEICGLRSQLEKSKETLAAEEKNFAETKSTIESTMAKKKEEYESIVKNTAASNAKESEAIENEIKAIEQQALDMVESAKKTDLEVDGIKEQIKIERKAIEELKARKIRIISSGDVPAAKYAAMIKKLDKKKKRSS